METRLPKKATNFPKTFTYIVSGLLGLAALGAFSMGIVWLTRARHYSLLAHVLHRNGSLSIIISIIMLLVVSVGILAIFNGGICFLSLYGASLFALFWILIIFAISGVLDVVKIDDAKPSLLLFIDQSLQEAIHMNDSNTTKTSKHFIDDTQQRFQCCGANGYQDYKPYPVFASCCRKMMHQCKTPYKYGCVSTLLNAVRFEIRINIIFCSSVSILPAVGAALVSILTKRKIASETDLGETVETSVETFSTFI